MTWQKEVKEFIEELNMRVVKSQFDSKYFEQTAERLIELYGLFPQKYQKNAKRAIIQLIQAVNGSYWTYKSYLLDTNYHLKQVVSTNGHGNTKKNPVIRLVKRKKL